MSLPSNFQRWHSIDCTNLNSPVAGEIVPNVSILWMQLKSMSGWPLLLFIFFFYYEAICLIRQDGRHHYALVVRIVFSRDSANMATTIFVYNWGALTLGLENLGLGIDEHRHSYWHDSTRAIPHPELI